MPGFGTAQGVPGLVIAEIVPVLMLAMLAACRFVSGRDHHVERMRLLSLSMRGHRWM
jgi:hypothetical protein